MTTTKKEETAIVPAADPDANLPMGQFETDDGLGEFEASDLSIPWIKIVQPTSEEGTKGTFLQSLTGEESPTVDAIFLKIQRGRIKWLKGKRDAPECKSLDFYHPAPELESPLSPVCCEAEMKNGVRVMHEICEHGKWTGTGKERNPPECALTYTFLGLMADIETGGYLPFMMTVKGKNLAPAKRFISAVKLKRSKLADYSVTLSLKSETNDKGTFYVAKYGDMTRIDAETKAEIQPYIEAFSGIELRPAEHTEDTDEGLDGV